MNREAFVGDEFWIVRSDCGIKTFPRAGSTTILNIYGYGQSRKRWLESPRKFIVVRNPLDRLLSAYQLFQDRRYGDVPKLYSVNDAFDYIFERSQEDCDVHFRSQWTQLLGYEPQDEDLVEMEYFLANPPLKIENRYRNLWLSRTPRRADETFDPERYEKWKELYLNDFDMWDRAKKAPKERGPSTGDDYE